MFKGKNAKKEWYSSSSLKDDLIIIIIIMMSITIILLPPLTCNDADCPNTSCGGTVSFIIFSEPQPDDNDDEDDENEDDDDEDDNDEGDENNEDDEDEKCQTLTYCRHECLHYPDWFVCQVVESHCMYYVSYTALLFPRHLLAFFFKWSPIILCHL